MCGQKKIKNFSVNTNAENPASSNTGASNQPLITVGMLERLNGDEKGDAIVSVRGYEPIWTRFTPSYELAKVYFADGKADISKREAVLFDKSQYVFDIDKSGQGQSVENKALDEIAKDDKKESVYLRAEEERLAELDKKWQKVIDDIHVKLNEFVKMLKGRDASAVLSIKLENKASFLYSITGDYCQSEAYEIRNSVKPHYLMAMFRRKIKDEKFLALIEAILTNGGDCLPIGYYTSQWFSNFFLEGFDHFVKEELKIKYYVRYVDDMVLADTNKRKLRKAIWQTILTKRHTNLWIYKRVRSNKKKEKKIEKD